MHAATADAPGAMLAEPPAWAPRWGDAGPAPWSCCAEQDTRLPDYLRVQGYIGKGMTGEVVQAWDARIARRGGDTNRAKVAVKLIPRGPQVNEYVQREVLHLRNLWHPHIVQFREVLVSHTHLCILMEPLAGGSIFEYVQEYGFLPESLARWFLQQAVMAVDYSHMLGVCNRDVKLAHLLVADPTLACPYIKLIDFGACKHDNDSEPDTYIGTRANMAPEVLNCLPRSRSRMRQFGGGWGRYDGKLADIWSLGMCLFHMLFGTETPMNLNPGPSVMSRTSVIFPCDATDGMQEGEGVPPPISDECRNFLNGMLQYRPENRLNMDAIWHHDWFKKDLPVERDFNSRQALARMEEMQDVPGSQSEAEILHILAEAQRY